MISDGERREVAENIRYLTIRPYIRYKEQAFDEIANTVLDLEDHHDINAVLEKLADLIDRPMCEMTREGEGFRCSACGAFHDMSGFEEFPWPRCPICGAEVV